MSILPIEVLCCYSSEDEQLKEELLKHLSPLRREGEIETWHFRKISAGREWEGKIHRHLDTARIVLLLVSPSFIHSDYCYDVEMKRAMERHEAGEARVIPVILRPVDWHRTLIGKLQALPRDGKPVSTWSNRDEAFLDIAKGIGRVCEEIQKEARTGDSQRSQRRRESEERLGGHVYCSRCGIRPGGRTACTGVYTEHAFREYQEPVYCSRCGISPGGRTTCTGLYTEHDFREYKGPFYCSRCGISPGERTTCTGLYTEHNFVSGQRQ